MCIITLIATVHSEKGYCNSDELYQIIERIKPDIIFEEQSKVGYSAIYHGTRTDSLETKTIKKYLINFPITHIPIDLDLNELIDLKLKKDIIEMFNVFSSYNEYQELEIMKGELTYLHGFPFLNSNQCKEILEQLHLLENKILRLLNHERLYLTHKKWFDIIDIREKTMMDNIYNYSIQNKYNNALFLIGAEHRKPIMDLVPKFEKTKNLELRWNFNYFIE